MKLPRTYDESIHRTGRIWMALAILLTQSIPFLVSAYFNAWPSPGTFLAAFIPTAMVFWTSGVIEVVTYTPMLGTGGTYLGFVTGNLSNLKVPCALAAMEQAKVEPMTKEGEVISTLAIATSSLVKNAILALGALSMTFLLPILSAPVLQPAFAQILPALFGALGVVYLSKNWKLALVPMALMVALFLVAPGMSVSTLIPIGALVAIAAARLFYRLKWV